MAAMLEREDLQDQSPLAVAAGGKQDGFVFPLHVAAPVQDPSDQAVDTAIVFAMTAGTSRSFASLVFGIFLDERPDHDNAPLAMPTWISDGAQMLTYRVLAPSIACD